MTALTKLRSAFKGSRSHAPCIGVEFGSEALHLVQCESNEKPVRVRAAISVPYPVDWEAIKKDRRRLRKFVSAALDKAAFTGRQVYSAMPASQVRIMPLTFRVPAGQTEQATIWRLLQEKLRSDLSEEIVDYLPVKGLDAGENETHVLATVARRADVLAHLRYLEDAGLEPQALEVGPAALSRLLSATQLEDQQSALLVNFGLHRSYITIVVGGRLALDREVNFGEIKLVEKLASALQVEPCMAKKLMQEHGFFPDHKASVTAPEIVHAISEILHPEFSILTEEVGHTLIYIASKMRGRTPDCLVLHGSLTAYPGIVACMQRFVDIKVQVLHPFDMLNIATPAECKTLHGPHHGVALAMGLAMRAAA